VPGVKPGLAISLTIKSYTGLPDSGLRKAFPGTGSARSVKMNATHLGEKVGIPARSTNKALREICLQSKPVRTRLTLSARAQSSNRRDVRRRKSISSTLGKHALTHSRAADHPPNAVRSRYPNCARVTAA
jgi:hypothetical protein